MKILLLVLIVILIVLIHVLRTVFYKNRDQSIDELSDLDSKPEKIRIDLITCSNCKYFDGEKNCSLHNIDWVQPDFGCTKGEHV